MEANYFTILYWFCHTSAWIHHGCTWVPNPEYPSHLPPHMISLGHPNSPAPSILYFALNLDWQFVFYMILYMFQCYSLKSSHSCLLQQSPTVCFLHLCLFCCLTYRVIVTIFLNSIYMHSMGYNVYFWVYMCDLTMHIIASPLNKKLFCPKFETEKCIDKP